MAKKYLVGAAVLLGSSVIAMGCASKSDESVDSSEGALVTENSEASDMDDDLEVGVEAPLSGAEPAEPGAPGEGDEAALVAKVKTNPGKFFTPAGCITTTVVANVATSVFKGCTGPNGMATLNGTVVSTLTVGVGSLVLKHDAKDFQINGATVSHTVTLTYTKDGGVYTAKRVGSTTGKTAKGKDIAQSANFTTTYDSATKCIKRDGSGEVTIGAGKISRSIAGYERCGVGSRGCPKSGTITLTRGALSLVVKFPGGATVDITRPNGTTFSRPLACQAS